MYSLKFNKSDYRFILFYFIAAAIWLLYRWNIQGYTSFEMSTGLLGFIVKNLSLLFVFKWLINEHLVIKRNYVLFGILAFVAWEIAGFLDMWRDYHTANSHWELPSFELMLIQNFNRGVDGSAMLIGFILGKKYYENKLDNIQLQNSQKELELKFLRTQYDPHFLYNSLNTIDALVDYSSKEKIKEYISHLAALYRYLINIKDRDIVTLNDEIDLAKNYIYLIETRFENDYNFLIIEQEKPLANYLPNGSLLTVLENVVKHNKAWDGNTIITKILIRKESVKIINTISRKDGKVDSLGTGLKNLNKQYELLSEYKVQIEETENSFTIILPLLNLVN